MKSLLALLFTLPFTSALIQVSYTPYPNTVTSGTEIYFVSGVSSLNCEVRCAQRTDCVAFDDHKSGVAGCRLFSKTSSTAKVISTCTRNVKNLIAMDVISLNNPYGFYYNHLNYDYTGKVLFNKVLGPGACEQDCTKTQGCMAVSVRKDGTSCKQFYLVTSKTASTYTNSYGMFNV